MKDQVEALQAVALNAGILPQAGADATSIDAVDPMRPDAVWVMLPVDGRLSSDFNREVGAVICQQVPILFRAKGKIVTVEVNEKTGRVQMEDMIPHKFRSWVEKFMVCYREVFHPKAGFIKVKQTMGVDMAQTCLASEEFCRQMSHLTRVNTVRLPIQRKSGEIELLPIGYDEESCILTLAQAWEYNEDMTLAEAVLALDEMIREFPFQDTRSRAVFIAAMLGQFGFFLQPLDAKRVNFLFHANSARSGKTLLVEILLTIAWSYASVDSMPDDVGKLRDRLDTAVREAKPYLVLDDLEQTFLKSGTLNAFMTATWWSGRKFHSQEEFQEPKTPVIFLTANNLEITPDLAGRTLTCDLFTSEADAQERVIERPIDAEWLRRPTVHSQICSALWTIIKTWRDGGRGHTGRVVRGYETWSRIFGGIALAAGFEDPCVPNLVEGFGNTEYSDMLALVTALARDVVKVGEFEFSEVVATCRELNCFPHLIEGKTIKRRVADEDVYDFELTAKANSNLGKLLSRYGGKSFVLKDSGKRAMFDKRGKNRHRKYLIQVA